MKSKKSYFRTTKDGVQLIVPAKHTFAKTMRKQQNEKNKTIAQEKPEAKPESREK